ncbi:MAG: PASTA domain-containing protein [Treponema sp.]
MSLNTLAENIHRNGKVIIITSFIMLIIFIAVSVLIFFVSLKSAEQVMVPHVVGKELPEALLELQAKELYPRLQLRYTDNTVKKDVILEQSPAAGAIVKGGKRIELVISQSTTMDMVPNYIGENIIDVEERIQELSDKHPAIQIHTPHIFQPSEKPVGTILEQEPPAGMPITKNTVFTFVVSKGNEQETVKIPDLRNASLPTLYDIMQKTALTFVFIDSDTEAANSVHTVVVKEQGRAPEEEVPLFSTIKVALVIPKHEYHGSVCGILNTTLPEFPYPLTVSLNLFDQNGEKKQLVTFQHQGGHCSIPYCIPNGTTLSVEALNKEMYTMTAGS